MGYDKNTVEGIVVLIDPSLPIEEKTRIAIKELSKL